MEPPVGQLLLLSEDLLATLMNSVTIGRYSIIGKYVACFYDWTISLDQELAFIYPAPWNAVKAAYIFCRYYPLAVAPFHIWGLVGDHDHVVCKSYFHALYASALPAMFSAQFILMLRTYAFSGRKKWVLAVLSIMLFSFVGVGIWVMSRELFLTLLFISVNRTGCFAISDLQSPPSNTGARPVQTTFNYRLGMITMVATFFDCLNMFIMVRRCIQERGTLGSLGQRFVKQGILVYAVMTALNTLTLGTFFSSGVLQDLKGIGPWLAYILPSALSCRLVLMLRRAASPTETELRIEYSHLINEAFRDEVTTDVRSKSFDTSVSIDAQAHP
ncbi:hypothetical protein V8E53_006886 [Lactarius tabidus]